MIQNLGTGNQKGALAGSFSGITSLGVPGVQIQVQIQPSPAVQTRKGGRAGGRVPLSGETKIHLERQTQFGADMQSDLHLVGGPESVIPQGERLAIRSGLDLG